MSTFKCNPAGNGQDGNSRDIGCNESKLIKKGLLIMKQYFSSAKCVENGTEMGNVYQIARREPLPEAYAKLPFIRKGDGMFVDVPEDIGRIMLLRDCAAGNRCLSELDSENLVVAKVDVPVELITDEKHSGDMIPWFFYFWRPWDRHHAARPEGRRPFEAVTLEQAGLAFYSSEMI